jgi:hypothetical protein
MLQHVDFYVTLCRLSQYPPCIQFHFFIVKLSSVWLSVDSSLNLLFFGSCRLKGLNWNRWILR